MKFLAFDAYEVRFPRSLTRTGSDAMNRGGDYSAAYAVAPTFRIASARVGRSLCGAHGPGASTAMRPASVRRGRVPRRAVLEKCGKLCIRVKA